MRAASVSRTFESAAEALGHHLVIQVDAPAPHPCSLSKLQELASSASDVQDVRPTVNSFT